MAAPPRRAGRRFPAGITAAPDGGIAPADRPVGPPRQRVGGGPAEPVDVDADPFGQLHEVLVAHEVVGVLGDEGHRRLGRRRPALDTGQVGRPEEPLEPELEEGPGALDRRRQPGRVGEADVGRVLPRGEVGDREADLVAGLPLVDTQGRILTGVVGVVGQHQVGGEIP